MSRCVKSLESINSEISDKIECIKENINNAIDCFPQKQYRMKFSNKVCFVIYKFLNLFMKYQCFRYRSLIQGQNEINRFIELISEHINRSIPIQIQINEFISYIYEKGAKPLQKLEFKLKSLFNYIKNLPSITNAFYLVTNKELLLELKKNLSKVDVINGYIEQNYFDLLFESYIETDPELLNNFLQVFKINNISLTNPDLECDKQSFIIKNYRFLSNKQIENMILNDFGYFMNILINKQKDIFDSPSKLHYKVNINNEDNFTSEENENEPKEFDFQKFECLIQKVYSQIISSNVFDRRMYDVIRCASLRFLCDQYYIIHHKEWLENVDEFYVQNCREIINQTPRNLKISNEIIPENLYDVNFHDLFRDDDFIRAIEKMSTIQFLNCPIDIWHEVQIAIDLAMIGTRKLILDDQLRPNISFDDFFSIILPVFASAQISCPNALHSFLSLFKKMKKTSSTDIIAISTVALTGYVGNNI